MLVNHKEIVLASFLIVSALIVIYWNWLSEIPKRTSKYGVIQNKQSELNYHKCSEENILPAIGDLLHNVNLLKKSSDIRCQHVLDQFQSLYDVNSYSASQKLGTEFYMKMNMWLGNDSSLMKTAESQQIIVVHDVLKQQTTVYNPLRSKRPVPNKQNFQKKYLYEISKSSKLHCDFCNPLNKTAEDVFGRIHGKYSVSASNAFKLHKWHGLFIPYEHSIFDIDKYIFLDLWNTSLKWYAKTFSVDKYAQYPVMFWDMFPHAGASQMHVHIHGLNGIGHYPGQFQDILDIVVKYHENTKENYWDTVIKVHDTLGLALHYGNVTVLAPLVSRREHELLILCEQPSAEVFLLLYYIIQMYQNVLERYCFSLAGALPVLGDHNLKHSLPLVIFIGSRGDCSSAVSDVSSLELYLFNNVNTDPYQTITALQKYTGELSSKNWIHHELINLWSDII